MAERRRCTQLQTKHGAPQWEEDEGEDEDHHLRRRCSLVWSSTREGGKRWTHTHAHTQPIETWYWDHRVRTTQGLGPSSTAATVRRRKRVDRMRKRRWWTWQRIRRKRRRSGEVEKVGEEEVEEETVGGGRGEPGVQLGFDITAELEPPSVRQQQFGRWRLNYIFHTMHHI